MRAAEMLMKNGADCIITLGGDGTNRVVAKGHMPCPYSSGLNRHQQRIPLHD